MVQGQRLALDCYQGMNLTVGFFEHGTRLGPTIWKIGVITKDGTGALGA